MATGRRTIWPRMNSPMNQRIPMKTSQPVQSTRPAPMTGGSGFGGGSGATVVRAICAQYRLLAAGVRTDGASSMATWRMGQTGADDWVSLMLLLFERYVL